MFKKVLMGLGGLLVLVLIVVGLFVSNLDSIVKAAVEKYGSEAAQTSVELADVELSPTSGKGKLIGLRISNPEGFASQDAFVLGMIDIDVDMESVSGTGPIIINKVVIDKPQITFEVNEAGKSNMQTISSNAKVYAGKTAPSQKEEAKETSDNSDEEEARKIIIKKLTISEGQVSMSHSMLKGKKIEAKIPTFTLTDLGKSQGGLTAVQLSSKLLSVISQKASQAASKGLLKGFGLFSAMKEEGADAANEVKKEGVSIKGLFGR